MNYNKVHSLINSQHNFTVSKLAAAIQVPQTTLAKQLRNNKLTIEYLELISNYFGKTVGYFFDEEEGEGTVFREEKTNYTPAQTSECDVCKAKDQTIEILKDNLAFVKSKYEDLLKSRAV